MSESSRYYKFTDEERKVIEVLRFRLVEAAAFATGLIKTPPIREQIPVSDEVLSYVLQTFHQWAEDNDFSISIRLVSNNPSERMVWTILGAAFGTAIGAYFGGVGAVIGLVLGAAGGNGIARIELEIERRSPGLSLVSFA